MVVSSRTTIKHATPRDEKGPARAHDKVQCSAAAGLVGRALLPEHRPRVRAIDGGQKFVNAKGWPGRPPGGKGRKGGGLMLSEFTGRGVPFD